MKRPLLDDELIPPHRARAQKIHLKIMFALKALVAVVVKMFVVAGAVWLECIHQLVGCFILDLLLAVKLLLIAYLFDNLRKYNQ
jgi:uncharacterized membrane protein